MILLILNFSQIILLENIKLEYIVLKLVEIIIVYFNN